MPFEKDPNEIGSIFVSPGKGAYESVTFFGGKAFEIPDGTYRLENVEGVSKKTGNPYHLIRVCSVEEQEFDAQAEIDRARRQFATAEKAPF